MPSPPEADVGNRLWRLEQRQLDGYKRLEQLEERVERIRHAQEERGWRVEAIEKQIVATAESRVDIHERIDAIRLRIEMLERKPAAGAFGDNKIVQIVVYGLIGLVTALALGKAFVFPVGGGPP